MTYQTIGIKMLAIPKILTRFLRDRPAQVPLRLLQANLNTTEW